ncbi:MAG: DUF1553 domain-containing protein [Acidobacteria bacterium]|nr:DUF1553 domain-containing protein [Acidobacteriota bacterium]
MWKLLVLATAALAAEGDLPSRAQAILRKNCYSCHGPAAMAGLRIDQPGDLADGVVVPGKPENSRLWLMMTGKGRAMMPPTGKLNAADLSVIREWIVAGAKWPAKSEATKAPTWWSFQPVKPPAVPNSGQGWARNPIDKFIAAKLNQNQLKPAAEADRRTLLRRVSYDLTGLPPSADQIKAFEGDGNYEAMLDRLLASKHYGEKWGKHWLDLVRYGDTAGFEQDPYTLYAWRYRDYVIDSFNNDKPYNQFIKEQLAGDELFEDPRQQQGTGYFAVGPNRDMLYKVEDINRIESLTDFTDTTSSVFLGLTAGCARCHDHKYDPIPQRDYYRLQAVFAPYQKNRVFLHYNNGRSYDLGEVTRTFKLYDVGAELAALKKPYFDRIKAERLAKLSPEIQQAFAVEEEKRTPIQKALHDEHQRAVNPSDEQIWRILSEDDKPKLERLKSRLLALYGNYVPGPFSPGITDIGREAPKTHVPGKGTPYGEEVGPGFFSALGGGDIPAPPIDSLTTRRRSALAEWIARPDNPLTARVMVNRVWQYHFGRGIIATSSDYGMRGAPPSHPELLDYLADQFVRQGWSLKKLHREILLSATYRQSATASPLANEKDPDNALLSHFTRRRLEAEEIRDAVLSTTGTLNTKMYGRPVVPQLSSEELYGMSQPAANAWPITTDKSEHIRRSIYMLVKRTYRMPMLEVFDRPEGVLSCSRRESSTTSTQSLNLLNSNFTINQAEVLAGKATTIDAIWQQTLQRAPQESELTMAKEFLAKQTQLLGNELAARRELIRGLLNTNEFLYVE